MMTAGRRHTMSQASHASCCGGAPLPTCARWPGAVGVAGLLLFQLSCCQAEDQLYFFVDEQGVQHYANHPLEPRYRPLPPLPQFSWHAAVVAASGAESVPPAYPEVEQVEEPPPVDHEGIDR